MELRKEQITSRYKQLFPVDINKSEFDRIFNIIKESETDYKRVLILGDSLNYRPAFASLLLQYLTKYKRLPKYDLLGYYELVHFYFKDYDESMNMNNMNLDIFSVTVGFNEPINKKSYEVLSYVATRFYQDREKAMWIYLRGVNTEVSNLCKDLDYTVIDIRGGSKTTNQVYKGRPKPSNIDLF